MATPALARDGAWYIGGDFGAVIVEDTNFDIGATTDALSLAPDDYGIAGALFVGYDLGAFRLEGEAAYKKASIEDFTTRVALPSSAGPHPIGTHAAGGSESALSFMINGLFDFGDEDGLSGFLGGGVGMARVDYHDVRAAVNDGIFLEDSDTRFAWQVIAGVRQAVSRNVDLTFRYRYFTVDSVAVETFGAQLAESGKFRSHSILAGISFNFGAPPP